VFWALILTKFRVKVNISVYSLKFILYSKFTLFKEAILNLKILKGIKYFLKPTDSFAIFPIAFLFLDVLE